MKTRKNNRVKGWAKLAPGTHARTIMLRKCGKKCFLGPKKSFPICAKGTCKINSKGLNAAYIRARQWGKKTKSYKRIAKKAKSLLKSLSRTRKTKILRRKA